MYEAITVTTDNHDPCGRRQGTLASPQLQREKKEEEKKKERDREEKEELLPRGGKWRRTSEGSCHQQPSFEIKIAVRQIIRAVE